MYVVEIGIDTRDLERIVPTAEDDRHGADACAGV